MRVIARLAGVDSGDGERDRRFARRDASHHTPIPALTVGGLWRFAGARCDCVSKGGQRRLSRLVGMGFVSLRHLPVGLCSLTFAC